MLASARRVNLLYLVAAALFVATLALSAFTSGTDESGLSRSAGTHSFNTARR